jgi:adhesin transport system membrane fusion protein
MRHSDFAYVNDVRAAVELKTPRTARMLLLTIGGMLLCMLVWAHFAILDEVKRGSGRVIPSQQMQVVQSLEGGIVLEILAQEGAIVKKGQPLMRIDDTNFAAQFGEVRERRAAMAARVARLEAEANGAKRPVFEPELNQIAPKAVAAELSVFDARRKKIAQDVDVLQQAQVRLKNNLELLNKELDITRKLHAQKIVPEIELIRLERQASETRGQLAETNSKLSSVTASFTSQVEEDLAKSKGDLAVLDESIKSAQDKVRRTELRAPVYGIINKLNVTTVGAVVQPASNVMDIVPLDDTLLVEGRIRPQDIAFIRPGQDAVVKITAYDPSVYGSLKGKVERISADTIAEKNEKGDGGETFYRVIVRTEKNALGTPEAQLPIIPGMVATVEVLTGAKSVLDYLLKPARLLRDEALRER